MADFEHARALLRMAHKDFNALTGMLDKALFADEIFGFHVQQAVEKALKAWLCAYDVIYPPTHDLARLLTLLEKAGADIEEFWPLVQFTIFAVQARYEEGLTELDEPIDRAAEIQNVSDLLTRVEKLIVAKSLG
ncbi:MAG: HEPN domain-containing protein [Gallionella sp.]|jgi:HEPN domain-containing protein|nr:HEPN domain-containing protein [Gallionella sp.]